MTTQFAYVACQDDFYIRKVPITDLNRNSFMFCVGVEGSNIFANELEAIQYLDNIADHKINLYQELLQEWQTKKANVINIIEE